jgi:hypothetical protein
MVSAAWAVAVGMLGLAAPMGIGRFAFTPLMPLMQEHAVLTMAQGGWLARTTGYLAGALLCVFANPNPDAAACGTFRCRAFHFGDGPDRRLMVTLISGGHVNRSSPRIAP